MPAATTSESSNYTTKEYCERAINRFKSHAIIGTYTIEAADGKFLLRSQTQDLCPQGCAAKHF
ncbi:MAG: hypothetical protein L6V83_07250 [Christensenella sp.]|nr:MAG: hypothetical protein L6V83_07250 [Christensenella sp.]